MLETLIGLGLLIAIAGGVFYSRKRPKSRGERAKKKGDPNAGKKKSGPQPKPATATK